VPAPRRSRGSGASPSLPGDALQHKASKRRRPPPKKRRQARLQREEDAAAAADAPSSTLLAALTAWVAIRAAYWVLRTIQFGFRVSWASRPTQTRSKGYELPPDEFVWASAEVGRWVSAGYARRLSPAAGAGAPWVSLTFIVYGSKPRLVVDLRLINLHVRKRVLQYQRLPNSWPRSSQTTTSSLGT